MVTAAKAAGKVLIKYLGKIATIQEKKDAGLVTNADLEAEQKIIKILGKTRPDFTWLTEETSPDDLPSQGRWVIDPLDGTTNFVHGFPMFCVSIAAEWEGQVIAGVIYNPCLKDLYIATLGGGAFCNGKKMKVSNTAHLRDSLLTTGFTYRKRELLHTEMDAFERLAQIARGIRRPGSAALDLAYTARGVFDGFWERNLSPWDVAAGALMVKEAGGKVTDLQGKAFNLANKQILASNLRLHSQILDSINPEHCVI